MDKIKNKLTIVFSLLFLTSFISAIDINTESIYQENKSLLGEMIITFNETEQVPELSLIKFSTDTKQYEFPLNNISSKKVEYLPVYFSLKIIPKKTREIIENKTQISENKTLINETVPKNNTEMEISNSTEQNNINQTASITGNVIGSFFRSIFNFFQRLIMTGRVTEGQEIIQGEVKADEQIIYTLSNGQSLEIISGSVKTDAKELPESEISIETNENDAIITTNYSKEKIEHFNINLENLNMFFEEEGIIISIIDNRTELVSEKINLNKEEILDLVKEKLSLSKEEIKILEDKFRNETMKIVEEKQLGNRLIIKYSLGEYWFEPSYSLNAKEQEKEDDKIRWLKDLAKTISEDVEN